MNPTNQLRSERNETKKSDGLSLSANNTDFMTMLQDMQKSNEGLLLNDEPSLPVKNESTPPLSSGLSRGQKHSSLTSLPSTSASASSNRRLRTAVKTYQNEKEYRREIAEVYSELKKYVPDLIDMQRRGAVLNKGVVLKKTVEFIVEAQKIMLASSD